MTRRRWLPSVGVAAIALALYLPGVEWGTLDANRPEITRGWGVDDETPLGTLSELTGIRRQRPTRNLGYPLMHPLMLGVVYTPYLGYLHATGGFDSPTEDYPYGLEDARTSLARLALLGHLLSVVLAVGVVVAAQDAGRQLGGERAGLASALFAALTFPMFYYARTGNVDVPTLFFTAVAYAAYVRILRGGFTRARAIALGVAVGFAVATKEPFAPAFIGMPLVLLPLHWRDLRTAGSRGFLRLPAEALLACIAAFAVGSGLLIDPERYLAHVAFARGRVADVSTGTVWFMNTFPRTWTGHVDLSGLIGANIVDSLTLAGVALALAGIFVAYRRSPRLAALSVPAITYFAVLFWSVRTSQLRYVLPITLVLAIFAGFATHAGLASRWRIIRAGTAAIAACALGLGLLRGLDLTHAMMNDSRYAASQWIEANAPETGTVAFFGPWQKLPVIPAQLAMVRANEYLGAVHAPRTGPEASREIAQRWRSDPPAFIILAPDHSSAEGTVHSASVPDAIFAGLEDGSLGFDRAGLFQTPRLLPWLPRPALDYPVVNPPIRIYVPTERNRGSTE